VLAWPREILAAEATRLGGYLGADWLVRAELLLEEAFAGAAPLLHCVTPSEDRSLTANPPGTPRATSPKFLPIETVSDGWWNGYTRPPQSAADEALRSVG